MTEDKKRWVRINGSSMTEAGPQETDAVEISESDWREYLDHLDAVATWENWISSLQPSHARNLVQRQASSNYWAGHKFGSPTKWR